MNFLSWLILTRTSFSENKLCVLEGLKREKEGDVFQAKDIPKDFGRERIGVKAQ